MTWGGGQQLSSLDLGEDQRLLAKRHLLDRRAAAILQRRLEDLLLEHASKRLLVLSRGLTWAGALHWDSLGKHVRAARNDRLLPLL